MHKRLPAFILLFLMTGLVMIACSNQGRKYTSPAGYNLDAPQKIIMPESLLEISGISFNKGNSDTLYAQQDEQGRLFYLKPGDQRAAHMHFARGGDYEDVTIWRDTAIMLRSDGTLFTFPLHPAATDVTDQTIEYKKPAPKGEYEGLYADEAENRLYLLCKKCEQDKDFAGGYTFTLDASGITPLSSFRIDTAPMAKAAGGKKFRFHPSALTRNRWTGQWFILSSSNRMLVVTNKDFQVQEVHLLNPAVYHQPEGIAFDARRNLYISNEGDDVKNGNVLRINYKSS